MSRNSQAKRAARAKQRARHRAQERQPPAREEFRPGPEFGLPPTETPRDRAVSLLRTVGRAPLPHLQRELVTLGATVAYGAVGDYLLACLRESYGHGWLPAELVRQARLKVDVAASDLMRWLVAAERTADGLGGVHRHWRQQFEQVDPPRLDTAHRWVERWAEWQRFPTEAGLETLLRLLSALVHLPVIELLAPPPPGIRAARPVVGNVVAEASPGLAKVRALLAKAESTEHEAEASAFTAKAHELMTRHAIDLATVLHTEHRDPGRPSMVRIPVDPPYPDAKALLLQTVAEQTRCRSFLIGDVQLATVIGYPSDLEAVELLFTSLLVQAQHALGQASAGARPGSRQRSSGFRSAFLLGFSGRIGERLAEVNRLTFADEQAGTFLPVLRSQEERIEEFLDSDLGGRFTQGRVRGGYDAGGYQRGVLAGDAAHLTAGAVAD